MKYTPHHARSLTAAITLFGSLVTGANAAVMYPASLSENTTGEPDSLALGPPLGGYDFISMGLGTIITYDFESLRVTDGFGSDFTLWETNWGGEEFDRIDVLVSVDGIGFTSVNSTATATGLFVRNYDLSGSGLSSVRYVRVEAAYLSGFDIDALGAIHSAVAVATPEPSSTALLGLGGLALMLRRRR